MSRGAVPAAALCSPPARPQRVASPPGPATAAPPRSRSARPGPVGCGSAPGPAGHSPPGAPSPRPARPRRAGTRTHERTPPGRPRGKSPPPLAAGPRYRRPLPPRGRSHRPFPPHRAKIRLKWPPEAAGSERAAPGPLGLSAPGPPSRPVAPHRPYHGAGSGAAAAACGAGLLRAGERCAALGARRAGTRAGRGMSRGGRGGPVTWAAPPPRAIGPARPGPPRPALGSRSRGPPGRPSRGRAQRRREEAVLPLLARLPAPPFTRAPPPPPAAPRAAWPAPCAGEARPSGRPGEAVWTRPSLAAWLPPGPALPPVRCRNVDIKYRDVWPRRPAGSRWRSGSWRLSAAAAPHCGSLRAAALSAGTLCRSAVTVPRIAAVPDVARGWALCTPRKGHVLLMPFAVSLFHSEWELCCSCGCRLSVSTDLGGLARGQHLLAAQRGV